jgi:predicted lipoprotein with Yx(FWY)xxD motif
MRFLLMAAAAATMLAAAPASAQMTMGGAKKTADGFVDSKGLPLYTYIMDGTAGVSACNDGCAKAWPPMAATAADKAMGDWSVITRNDGTRQWTYRGHPLYTFAKDEPNQDATGVSGAWNLAK